MSKPLIIIGSGGHASILYDILKTQNKNVIGVVDSNPKTNNIVLGDLKLLGDDEAIKSFNPLDIKLVNGIGINPGNQNKENLEKEFIELGYTFATVIHPTSIIGSNVIIKNGAQVLAGSVININSYIGKGCIINTGSIIEHDCKIGDFNNISPGVVLCGNVNTGKNVYIGAGTVITQNIKIGENVVISSGSNIYKDVKSNSKIYGLKQ